MGDLAFGDQASSISTPVWTGEELDWRIIRRTNKKGLACKVYIIYIIRGSQRSVNEALVVEGCSPFMCMLHNLMSCVRQRKPESVDRFNRLALLR